MIFCCYTCGGRLYVEGQREITRPYWHTQSSHEVLRSCGLSKLIVGLAFAWELVQGYKLQTHVMTYHYSWDRGKSMATMTRGWRELHNRVLFLFLEGRGDFLRNPVGMTTNLLHRQ